MAPVGLLLPVMSGLLDNCRDVGRRRPLAQAQATANLPVRRGHPHPLPPITNQGAKRFFAVQGRAL